ncbi:FtsQ-type POTRA domain-containing protein [Microbacterium nymphoidis]|uniref:FtsQ-type POTRA domain-containing protein n=1 Tax=Microbacterium nymphoidis TaxID=2898586 RepID=UPI001E5D20A7|nr:FtsQ-type POTRA domain-containing protein [Microbacterium nymphoidis]MCD2499211.1 FtsQ-type POTRA domain-containing protein [Microbacterium nymphoidis]
MRRPQQPPRPPRREPERPATPDIDEVSPAAARSRADASVSPDEVDTAVDYEDVRAWVSLDDAAPIPVGAPSTAADEHQTQELDDLRDPAGDDEFAGFGTGAARRFGHAPVIDLDAARPEPVENEGADAADRPRSRFGRGRAQREAADDSPDEQAIGRWRDVWRATRARRRALRTEMRRFTVRSRRRRLAWIVSIATLVVVAGGSYAAAYSPLFAIEKVTVVGASALDPTALEQSLQSQLGRPLAAIDASEVKAALVGFPMVETYSIEARPPHEMVLRIVERTPVGVIASDAGFTLVDAAGVALSTTPEVPPGQPVISAAGGAGSEAFVAAGLIIRSLPETIRPAVTAVSATTAQDVTLTLAGSGVTVIWGGSDRSAEKARVLTATMTASPPGQVSTYDVSSPSAVVVR